jgi:hypothetical protein
VPTGKTPEDVLREQAEIAALVRRFKEQATASGVVVITTQQVPRSQTAVPLSRRVADGFVFLDSPYLFSEPTGKP